ncbi:MAG: rRNA maturation RNase YbeY [Pseudomonadota bacterium]
MALTDLIVEAEGWTAALPDLAEAAEEGARLALAGTGLGPEGYEIAVLACDDARIAALNAEFRGKSAPTNVLSWPAHPLQPAYPGGSPMPPPSPGPLGDIAIALETCDREAQTQGLALKDHVIHLILHGSLHLLGYDHETEEDANLMEGIERRQLVGAGYADPYDGGKAGVTRD